MMMTRIPFTVCALIASLGFLAGQSHHRVGPTAAALGTGQPALGQELALRFDVHRELRLDSVQVVSASAGQVVVRLLDAQGVVLATRTRTLSGPGSAELELHLSLPQGTGYTLDAVGSTVTGLMAHPSGASFPYAVPGVIELQATTALSSGVYGPFYDLRVTEVSGPFIERFGTGALLPTTRMPAGWRNQSGEGLFFLDAEGTPTLGTGPESGATGAFDDRYVYFETTPTAEGDQAILLAPPARPQASEELVVQFSWHMHGARMGTLALEVWQGDAWVTAWTRSGDQGSMWHTDAAPLPLVDGLGSFRFVGTDGAGTTSDMAIDDVVVRAVAAQPIVGEFEVNSPEATLLFDGRVGTPTTLAVSATEGMSELRIESIWTGMPFDVLFSLAPAKRRTEVGTFVSGAGQVLSLDLGSELLSLNGGASAMGLDALTPAAFPGPMALPVFPPQASVAVTGQMAILDPTHPDLLRLSQPATAVFSAPNLTAAVVSSVAVREQLALSDDGVARVALPFAFSFQGATWSEVFVGANGVLTFGAAYDAWPVDGHTLNNGRPTISTLGADLDPQRSGRVTVREDATGLEIVFDGVRGFGASLGNRFHTRLELDAVTMHWHQIALHEAVVGVTRGAGLCVPRALNLSNAAGTVLPLGRFTWFERFGPGASTMDLEGRSLKFVLDAAGYPIAIQ